MGSQKQALAFPFLSGGLADKDNVHTFLFRQLDFSKTIGNVSHNKRRVKIKKKRLDARIILVGYYLFRSYIQRMD